MRFSLRDLFGIITFSAFLAWCVARVGTDNEFFWITVCASALLSTLFVCVARSERWRGYAWLAPIAFLLFGAALAAPLIMVANVALLFLAGLFCSQGPPLGLRTLCTIVLIAAALSLEVGMVPGMHEHRILVALRQEFPIVSLKERLEYEQRKSDSATTPPTMSAVVALHLTDREKKFEETSYREGVLTRIHRESYERFVRAAGFGVRRMPLARPQVVRRPRIQNISFYPPSLAEADFDSIPWRDFEDAGKSNDIEHLHKVSQIDFLDAESFGAIVEPNGRVAGFLEHAFHYSPAEALTNRFSWRIERLELVSLLKFDEPRVYVLDHLPRMDQLSGDDVPTRPLDQFEADALKQLWTEKDLVVSNVGREYRMLGSLRAANKCLDCHTARRGELLGAFSYVLHRGIVAVGGQTVVVDAQDSSSDSDVFVP